MYQFVCDILRTLKDIALRFDSFEQQAHADRDRVSKLCEHLNVDSVVTKKGKHPRRML